MADFSSFSSSLFHTSTWINAALKDHMNEEEPLDTYLAQLAIKLHIISQDYTDQLENAMMDSMSQMPRINNEIAHIEDSLRSIQAEMNTLSVQLKEFDEKNVAGSEELSRLDTLKGNLEKCRDTLLEHDRWNVLVAEAKSFMENGGKLSESADRIEILHRSLNILQELPGHEERQQTCESLSEGLLSALQVRVHVDIVGSDISLVQDYLYVYDRLGRKSQLQTEYATHRPSVLNPRLEELSSPQNVSTATDSVYWITSALRMVTDFVNEESLNTTVLFGKEQARLLLCDMVQVVFSQLLTRQITDKFSQTYGKTEVILDMFQRLDSFVKEFTLLVRDAGIDKLFDTYSVVYRSCYDFLVQYPEHESSALKTHFTREIDSLNVALASAEEEQDFDFDAKPVDSTTGTSASAGVDSNDRLRINRSSGRLAGGRIVAHPEESLSAFSQRFYSSADQLLPAVQAVLIRSSLFMGGLSLKLTFRYVGSIFSSYIKFLSVKVDELRQACGFTVSDRVSATGYSHTTLAPASGADQLFALDPTVSKGVIQGYARQIEVYGLNEKELVPAALLILLTLGKLTILAKDLDHFLSGIFGGLSSNLSRDYKASFQSFLTTATSTTTLTNISSLNTSLSYAKAGNNMFGSSVSQIYTNFVLHNNFDQLSELKSFLSIYSSNARHSTQTLSYVVSSSLQRLRTVAGLFLFELSTSSVDKLLSNYSLDDAVSTGHVAFGHRVVIEGHQQLSLDNFLPQPLITQVGEHLLSLFQEFDAFPTMERVLEMRALLGEAHTLTLGSPGWARVKDKLVLPKEDDSTEMLCKRTSCVTIINTFETAIFGASISVSNLTTTSTVYPGTTINETEGRKTDESDDNKVETSELDKTEESEVASNFVNEWLGAIADSVVVGVFLLQVLKLDTLTSAGAAQLSVDIDYLSNVLNAMGLSQHPLLLFIRHLLQRDLDSLRTGLDMNSLTVSVRSGPLLSLHKIFVSLVSALDRGTSARKDTPATITSSAPVASSTASVSAVYATTTDVLPTVVTTTEISIETTAEPMTTSAATNDDAAIESVTPQSVEEVPPEAHDDQPNSENMESIQEAVVAQE